MPNQPPPLVLPLVSIMRCYGDLFHIWPFTVQRTISSPSFIMSFPVTKLRTLRFVGFINITSRCTSIFSDPLDQTFSETFHSLEDV